MGKQVTTFPIAEGQLETITTTAGKTPRHAAADHLDELEAALVGPKPLEMAATPAITRSAKHYRTHAGKDLEFQIDPKKGEDRGTFAGRIIRAVTGYAEQFPVDS